MKLISHFRKQPTLTIGFLLLVAISQAQISILPSDTVRETFPALGTSSSASLLTALALSFHAQRGAF